MNSHSQTLPTTIEALQRLCLKQQTQLQQQVLVLKEKESRLSEQDIQLLEKEDTISYLKEQLLLLRSKRFKSQSETLKAIQGQLFDEAELELAIREMEEALAKAEEKGEAEKAKRGLVASTEPQELPKKKPKRKELPAHLRRIDIEIDVSDEDKQMMGDEWELIGYDSSEQLAVSQREYYVKRLKRAKYVRKQRSKAIEEQARDRLTGGIKIANRPEVMLPKSIADATLLADVLASKFIDGMSFYRTDKRLKREGIDIGYSTLCDWPIQLLERLKPLAKAFYDMLAQADLWHLDETTLQVLQEAGRKAQQKSYLWAIRGGPPNQPIVAFHYSPYRNYEALADWLEPCLSSFNGVIITEEHGAYNRLRENHSNIKAHAGCWAHCRRKFADAAHNRGAQSDAHKVLQKIAILYRLEKQTEGYTGQAKKELRQELVKPQLEEIKAYLERLSKRYLKQGYMRKAIQYALNHWEKFTAFIDHPELPIDNNPIERAIRPFTIGRKNWMFAGSPRGAEASAFIYSLVETAKANGWEPKAYLTELFTRYPKAQNQDEIRALLPMFLKTDD